MKSNTKIVFLSVVLICTMMQALKSATIYSGANGEWSSHIWSSNASGTPLCPGTCQPNCSFGSSGVLNIKNVVTVTTCSSGLSITGGATINLTGSTSKLTVTGNVSMTTSYINIAAGDTLIINGNLTLTSVATITVSGYIRINGNVNTSGNSSICGTGNGNYTGSLIGPAGTPGWCFTPSPLPIQLYSFNGDYLSESKVVQLNWVTASEVNNQYFTIEKSTDAENWTMVSHINGAGNSDQFRYYSTKDIAPFNGTSYYRLSQTDFDGKTTTYNIIPVEANTEIVNPVFVVFPNPIKENSINVTCSGYNIGDNITFTIQDLIGRILMVDIVSVKNKGSTEYLLSEECRLSKGIYFISAISNNKLSTQKLIVN
jgi:hypothetical protein